tara:strand:+ start:220 stop:807 length:588 start_codon:yes stop_codon:yes gene_type:complete
MNFVSLIKRELKDWVEFFIRYIPGKVGFCTRELYLKNRISYPFKNNRFEPGIRIDYPRNIKFGSNSYFGIDCKIYASEFSNIKIGSNVTCNSNVMINARGKGEIIIGDNVLIGPNVVLRSNNHAFQKLNEPIISQGMTEGKIIIENNVWIGSNCVILPNCRIGKGAIIAAGAVVTADVGDNCIVGGIPAKFIRKR